MPIPLDSLRKNPLFEKHFYIASIIWWFLSITALVLLSLTPIPQMSDFRSLVSEHLFSLVLVVLIVPFVLHVYVSHARLAQTKQEIAILDLQEKRRIIETLRTENTFRDSLVLKAQNTAQLIATSVASDLKNDSKWAADALREAAILGGAISVFGQRIHHFRNEKNAIAVNFFDFLLKRVKFLSTKFNRIILLLDSGTTVLPFFELFSKAAVKAKFSADKTWCDKTDIVTNNIPGISELIKHGRCNPTDRFDEIAIRCHVLPGTPLAVYSAIVGDKTVEAIRSFKPQSDKDYVIGLTTGNFVMIGENRISPLARGEGHYEIKREICDVSNEVYVIASLGKLIMSKSPTEFNQDLHFSTDSPAKGMQPYRAVEYSNINKIKLVTTIRESNESIMKNFSNKVRDAIFTVPPHQVMQDYGDGPDYTTEMKVEIIPHFAFNFDELHLTRYEQEMVELPHEYMRDPEIMSKYFHIPR